MSNKTRPPEANPVKLMKDAALGMIANELEAMKLHTICAAWASNSLKHVGLTGQECASRMGISRSFLGDLLHGRRNWSGRLASSFVAAITK